MVNDFNTLWPYFKKHAHRYIPGLLCLIVTSGGQLLIPQFLRAAIDTISTGTFPLSRIFLLGAQLVGVATVISIGRFGWRFFIHGASRRIERDLRSRLYAHLLTLSSNFYGRYKIGDLMARATNDMEAVRMATGMALVAFTDGVFMTLAIIIILFVQNPGVALYPLLPLPVITTLIIGLGRFVADYFRKVQEGFATVSQQAQEVFSGIRVIKSFVKENYFLDRFRAANESYQNRNMRLVRVWGVFNPAVAFLAGLTSLILLWVGGQAVILQDMSPGSFVAVLSYLSMLIWPMLGAGFTVNMIQRGRASLIRINEVLNERPDIANVENPVTDSPEAHIEVRALTYAYPDAQESVLKDLTFSVAVGETLGILGRTGSGKSTLIRLLPRLLDPPLGTVFIGGRDVRDYDLRTLRATFGVVPQDTFLFSASILDNIGFGMDDPDEQLIRKVADISTISRDMSSFPAGWNTEVGERGISLSGGQKQRVAISRAVAVRPRVLIFDDALSAVDTATEERILRELISARKGKTNIIISHRVSTLAFATRIIVLDRGRIIQRGSHAQLISEDGLYRQIYNLQQSTHHHAGTE
ncbi:MAG TPA: ABC transporter ATP-binding protein [Spirochaetia bacterium]|nr:ABC transporter ATP-binding protein [Spirochaetia bacterium]